MTWLNAAAWIGLAAIAGPLLVHILAQRRAPRVAFPTLRFINPARLVSIRRRSLEDVWLLIVRVAIVIAAVAATAGPFVVNEARRRAWDATTIRADIGDEVDVARGFQPRDRDPEPPSLQPRRSTEAFGDGGRV